MKYLAAMVTFLTCIVFIISLVGGSTQIIKSVTLTPNNPNSGGVRLMSNINEVAIVDNAWYISIFRQNAWQFIINVDKSFGFDPLTESSIKITVDSPAVSTNQLLFGFTTDNEQYISLSIPFSDGDNTKIYPFCDVSASSTHEFGFGDIASMPRFDRECDIAGHSCLNWKDMLPLNERQDANKLPITLSIENHPRTKTMSVIVDSGGFSQACQFAEISNYKGLKMYMAGNDNGGSYIVNSFQITSFINVPSSTHYPTNIPTAATREPSGYPTVSPSSDPTRNPLVAPTLMPSRNPSMEPTNDTSLFPTLSPSKRPVAGSVIFPTNRPSERNPPSMNPSMNPSSYPTGPPSSNPTESPSVVPTLAPSNIPTRSPSNIPSFAPTNDPTKTPADIPTIIPTESPSYNPSNDPSMQPSLLLIANAPTSCPKTGEVCYFDIRKANRCCEGHRGGSGRCVYKGTDLDGRAVGICCLRYRAVGCSQDSDCCDEYICDRHGICQRNNA